MSNEYEDRRRRWEAMQAVIEQPLVWCWAAIEKLEALPSLRTAALEVNRSSNDLLRRTRFWRMRVETHYAIVATAKFLRAVRESSEVDERYGRMLGRFPVVLEHLRNALEHDDDRGYWAGEYSEPHHKHQWNTDGGGWLGGEVDTMELLADLRVTFEELLELEQSRP